jgi:hypothetical protein
LKEIVAGAASLLTAEDKRKLNTAVSKKITQIVAGKIPYANFGDIFDINGNFLTFGIKFACTSYSNLMCFIMGATKSGSVNGWAGDNAWYYYKDFYQYAPNFSLPGPTVANVIGTTVLANNMTVLTKDTSINKDKIAIWMDNPTKYKTQLESLKGTVFMYNRFANTSNYDTYEHTGMIVGYRIDKTTGKAVLIFNDSTSNRLTKIDSTNGIGTTEYPASWIKGFGSFNIYNINY